jgi:hypothetical protein
MEKSAVRDLTDDMIDLEDVVQHTANQAAHLVCLFTHLP